MHACTEALRENRLETFIDHYSKLGLYSSQIFSYVENIATKGFAKEIKFEMDSHSARMHESELCKRVVRNAEGLSSG